MVLLQGQRSLRTWGRDQGPLPGPRRVHRAIARMGLLTLAPRRESIDAARNEERRDTGVAYETVETTTNELDTLGINDSVWIALRRKFEGGETVFGSDVTSSVLRHVVTT